MKATRISKDSIHFPQNLELDKKRFRVKLCPCGKSNKDGKFVPYKGYEEIGYCHSCGETFLPAIPSQVESWQQPMPKPQRIPSNVHERTLRQPSFITFSAFKRSLRNYENNNFVRFLITQFGEELATGSIQRYFIGTSKHWNGATVFWQLDTQGKVRTGRIMLYNPTTGKRTKQPYNHITWVHSAMKLADFNLNQCLFGEHLLKDISKPVAIVESEKTAVIASLYFPNFIWLATGGLQNLSQKRCNSLKGRNVILFPDVNCLEKWQEKAKDLKSLESLTISNLLERKATEAERQDGLDLADYLIRFNLNEFHYPTPEEPIFKQVPLLDNIFTYPDLDSEEEKAKNIFVNENFKPYINWSKEIQELEKFFQEATLPAPPIKLNQCSTITDPYSFVSSHLKTLKSHRDSNIFLPYLERLKDLKSIMV
jgi:hypothetical protein